PTQALGRGPPLAVGVAGLIGPVEGQVRARRPAPLGGVSRSGATNLLTNRRRPHSSTRSRASAVRSRQTIAVPPPPTRTPDQRLLPPRKAAPHESREDTARRGMPRS